MQNNYTCLIVDDEPTAREILTNHLSKIDNIELVANCSSAMEAFAVISTKKIDLIFLDINMPEISGLSFAKSINKKIKVIFTTAYREYAVDGFDLQAVDYLLKPISLDRLKQGVAKFIGENTVLAAQPTSQITQINSNHLFVRADRKMVKINFSDILFIESMSDYLKIHTIKSKVITRETISNIHAKLPNSDFIRTHRSYIVSVSKIGSFTHECIEIEENTIPISRSFKQAVWDMLNR